MGLVRIRFDVDLTEINCGECGGTYAINERYRAQQYEQGGSWTCPYCKCGWGYANNNENSKLKAQIAEKDKLLAAEQRRAKFLQENATAERAAREQTQRRLSATIGAKTRIVNRIKNGVCPCCNRTFVNLHQHMTTQHPDFQKVEGEKP